MISGPGRLGAVPAFEPFRAVRYAASHDLARVTAPPYDVLSDTDVDELTALDPHNVVRVDVPRGGDERYSEAAVTLNDWLATGDLVTDVEPTFTIYRRRFTDATGQRRELSGVLGALEVVDEGSGEVLAHERTTPKASTDRLELTRATHSNLSPVWCLSAYPGLSALLDDAGEPAGTVTVDGVEHVVERVSDPTRISEIRSAVASTPALIADGHHRYAVSRQYRDERRAEGGDPGAELTLAFVGELVADQLSVEAIHRLYTGIDPDALADALSERVRHRTRRRRPHAGGPGPHERRRPPRPRPARRVGLARPEAAARSTGSAPSTASGSRRPWPRPPPRSPTSTASTRPSRAVRSGVATAAVLIRPVSVEEIRRTAEGDPAPSAGRASSCRPSRPTSPRSSGPAW